MSKGERHHTHESVTAQDFWREELVSQQGSTEGVPGSVGGVPGRVGGCTREGGGCTRERGWVYQNQNIHTIDNKVKGAVITISLC